MPIPADIVERLNPFPRVVLMTDESAWSEAVARLPFGVVVKMYEAPDVVVIVEVNNYRPRGRAVSLEEPPAVGDRIVGVVVDHAEFNRQIRLRVGDPRPGR